MIDVIKAAYDLLIDWTDRASPQSIDSGRNEQRNGDPANRSAETGERETIRGKGSPTYQTELLTRVLEKLTQDYGRAHHATSAEQSQLLSRLQYRVEPDTTADWRNRRAGKFGTAESKDQTAEPWSGQMDERKDYVFDALQKTAQVTRQDKEVRLQSIAQEVDLIEIDRRLERDARRYDGGEAGWN